MTIHTSPKQKSEYTGNIQRIKATIYDKKHKPDDDIAWQQTVTIQRIIDNKMKTVITAYAYLRMS